MKYSKGMFLKNKKSGSLFKVLEVSHTSYGCTRLVLINGTTIDGAVSIRILKKDDDVFKQVTKTKKWTADRCAQRNGSHNWRKPFWQHHCLPKWRRIGKYYDWSEFDGDPNVKSPKLHSQWIEPHLSRIAKLESKLACLFENKSGFQIVNKVSKSKTLEMMRDLVELKEVLPTLYEDLEVLKKIIKNT